MRREEMLDHVAKSGGVGGLYKKNFLLTRNNITRQTRPGRLEPLSGFISACRKVPLQAPEGWAANDCLFPVEFYATFLGIVELG